MTIGNYLKLFQDEIPSNIAILQPDEYTIAPTEVPHHAALIIHKNDNGRKYTNMNRNVKYVIQNEKMIYILLSGFYGENKSISLEDILGSIILDSKSVEIINKGEVSFTIKSDADYRDIINDRTLCRTVSKISYAKDGIIQIYLDFDMLDIMNFINGIQ